jgi:hypothetical protein
MFKIDFAIENAEWTRSASMRFDPESEPVIDCFYGFVQMTADGVPLFAERPFQLSVADLACSLARRLGEGYLEPDSSSVARFRQLDDALEISFRLDDDVVRIAANLSSSNAIETDRASCKEGIRRFLREFAFELVARVDEPFEWKDLEALRRFSAADKGMHSSGA